MYWHDSKILFNFCWLDLVRRDNVDIGLAFVKLGMMPWLTSSNTACFSKRASTAMNFQALKTEPVVANNLLPSFVSEIFELFTLSDLMLCALAYAARWVLGSVGIVWGLLRFRIVAGMSMYIICPWVWCWNDCGGCFCDLIQPIAKCFYICYGSTFWVHCPVQLILIWKFVNQLANKHRVV